LFGSPKQLVAKPDATFLSTAVTGIEKEVSSGLATTKWIIGS